MGRRLAVLVARTPMLVGGAHTLVHAVRVAVVVAAAAAVRIVTLMFAFGNTATRVSALQITAPVAATMIKPLLRQWHPRAPHS